MREGVKKGGARSSGETQRRGEVSGRERQDQVNDIHRGKASRDDAQRHPLMVECTDTGNSRGVVRRLKQTGMSDHYGPWHSHDSAPPKGAVHCTGGSKKKRVKYAHGRVFIAVMEDSNHAAEIVRMSGIPHPISRWLSHLHAPPPRFQCKWLEFHIREMFPGIHTEDPMPALCWLHELWNKKQQGEHSAFFS